jgi:3-hydroxyisobutyrate dehydrogenase
MNNHMTKIAFLGLGAMGSRMAVHLIKAGHAVVVWNRDPAKAAAVAAVGATIASSPADAADGAAIVMSMITDDDAAKTVWLDPVQGAITTLMPTSIAIECSTVTPAWIAELGVAVAARQARLLDAPVAGSRLQADAGQLIFMIGGDASTVDAVRPILAPLSANVLHVGALGHGVLLKLAVNALFAAQLQSVAELLGFLDRRGFEPKAAASLLGEFPIVATPIAGSAKLMAAGNFTPQFTVDLVAKDRRYIMDASKQSGASLPGVAVSLAAFQAVQAKGFGGANVTAITSVF